MALKFTKLTVGDAVVTSGTRAFKKLSAGTEHETVDVAELKEAYQGLDSPSGAVLKSCDCDTKWQTLYNEDLSKLSLNGTTLNITLPNTEAT